MRNLSSKKKGFTHRFQNREPMNSCANPTGVEFFRDGQFRSRFGSCGGGGRRTGILKILSGEERGDSKFSTGRTALRVPAPRGDAVPHLEVPGFGSKVYLSISKYTYNLL